MSKCDKIAKENNEMLKDICNALNIPANKTGDQPNPDHEEH